MRNIVTKFRNSHGRQRSQSRLIKPNQAIFYPKSNDHITPHLEIGCVRRMAPRQFTVRRPSLPPTSRRRRPCRRS
jgi:hypothetical protein